MTDARRVASKVSGTRSWMEALKKFAAYPVARDLDSLRAVVASVGAAFYQDFLYGPVEVLGLLWDDYTSCNSRSPT